jgi:hypothetical protein
MEKIKPEPTVKQEVINAHLFHIATHLAGLSQLHGVFYHGTYWHNGVPQPHSSDHSRLPHVGKHQGSKTIGVA